MMESERKPPLRVLASLNPPSDPPEQPLLETAPKFLMALPLSSSQDDPLPKN
jgi:hypothetical protein